VPRRDGRRGVALCVLQQQVSRALVHVSGDARLNFAETDTSDLTNIAQHPSMLTMKPRILHALSRSRNGAGNVNRSFPRSHNLKVFHSGGSS